jgi:hypothetical protein
LLLSQTFQLVSLARNLTLLFRNLALLLGLDSLLSLHLIAGKPTADRSERPTDRRPSTRASDCTPNDRASRCTQAATS